MGTRRLILASILLPTAIGTAGGWSFAAAGILILATAILVLSGAACLVRLKSHRNAVRPGRFPLSAGPLRSWRHHQRTEALVRYLGDQLGLPSAMALRWCGAAIARDVNLAPGLRIDHPALVAIGPRAIIDRDVVLETGVEIADHLLLATIRIGADAVIGADCRIGPGVDIGEAAIIPSGSWLPAGTRVAAGTRWHPLAAGGHHCAIAPDDRMIFRQRILRGDFRPGFRIGGHTSWRTGG